jgi:hypothetical protein
VSDRSNYQGYAGPPAFDDDGNVHKFEIDRRIARMSTATLVQVVTAPYDAGGNPISPGSPVAIGYVDVKPLVNQLDGLGNSMPHETVYHCSYHRYQGGLNAIIIDPLKGDVGKFVVADRDTSVVRKTNQQSNPGSLRRYNKADGTYFGMPQGPLDGSQTTPPVQYVTFPDNGIIVRDKSGNEIALVSDTNLNAPTVTGGPSQYIAFTSSGIKMADRYGNSIVMDSTGVTITSLNGSGPLKRVASGKTTGANTHSHPQDNDSAGDAEQDVGAPIGGT